MVERVHLDAGEIAAHLAATRLFALLDPASLARLAQPFRAARYQPGQLIARQGEADGTLWIVIDGQLSFDRRAPDDRIQHIGFRGYGTVIGERGVFTGERRANSVLTIEPTSLLYVDGEALWSALRDDPAAYDRLVLPEAVRERLNMQMDVTAVEGERRVALVRRHWVVLARGMVMPVVILALTVALAVVVAPTAGSPYLILGLAALALGVPILGAVWAFFDYRYDCLIVTNRRVIHIERTPFIDARRSEAPLARIQDIQVTTPSLAARLFGFGHIRIQTAGTRGAIEFTSVPEPEGVRETIFGQADLAQEHARREHAQWAANQIRLALGREAVGRTDDPGRRDELVEAEEAAITVPQFVQATILLISRLMPKMRMEEKGVVTWRKHWFILIRRTWIVFLPWLANTVILAAIALGYAPWPWRTPLVGWIMLVALLWWRYEDWRNDLYQLTDHHVIDIERRPLGFFEDRRQAKLSQIQDIRYTVPNPLATLLNFGNVMVETAAESGSFTFDFVYNPAGVQEEIFTRLDRQRAQTELAQEARRAEEITRWLAEYHRVANEPDDEGLPPTPMGPTTP